MHRLTVSIVLYQTAPKHLADTLRHLKAGTSGLGGPVKLFVVDNSPAPCTTLATLTAHWPGELAYRHGHGNPGFGAGHNLVLADCDSTYHLILNPDALLDADALCKGLAFLDGEPSAVAVAPRGRDERGRPLHLAKAMPSALALAVRGFLPARWHGAFQKELARYARHDLEQAQTPCPIEIASGCCLLARTAALKAVGGFDPSYFLYFEDFDLSLRLRAQGQLIYLPDMGLVHYGGDAARKGWRHRLWFLRSACRFFRTHGPKPA